MFSMTKSRELDEMQSQDADVNKCHYGEDVTFYPNKFGSSIDASITCTTPEDCQRSAGLHLPSPTCLNGYIFCISTGGCVRGGCPDGSVERRQTVLCDTNKVS